MPKFRCPDKLVQKFGVETSGMLAERWVRSAGSVALDTMILIRQGRCGRSIGFSGASPH